MPLVPLLLLLLMKLLLLLLLSPLLLSMEDKVLPASAYSKVKIVGGIVVSTVINVAYIYSCKGCCHN